MHFFLFPSLFLFSLILFRGATMSSLSDRLASALALLRDPQDESKFVGLLLVAKAIMAHTTAPPAPVTPGPVPAASSAPVAPVSVPSAAPKVPTAAATATTASASASASSSAAGHPPLPPGMTMPDSKTGPTRSGFGPDPLTLDDSDADEADADEMTEDDHKGELAPTPIAPSAPPFDTEVRVFSTFCVSLEMSHVVVQLECSIDLFFTLFFFLARKKSCSHIS
jgi:hypothetical protein